MRNRVRIARLLMACSLVLLLGFQAVWLRQVYEENERMLQREAGRAFFDAVRVIQDSLIGRIYFVQLAVQPPGDEDLLQPAPAPDLRDRLRLRIRQDSSLKSLFIMRRSDSVAVIPAPPADGPMPGRRMQRQRPMEWSPDMLPGAISLMLQEALPEADTVSVDSLLRLGTQASLRKAQIPVGFTLLSSPDSIPPAGRLLTGRYIDIPSRTHYALELLQVQPYLLRRCLPQGLFSAALFGIIALAFFFIYRTLAEQQRLSAQQQAFVSNVTHELKTPIATVSVALEALNSFHVLADPDRTREYLGIAGQEVQRLASLVDRVLSLSLLEQHQVQLHPELLDLQQLAEEGLAALRPQLDKTGAQVRTRLDGEDFRIEGDRMHLTGVLYNLLDNAVKYSEGPPDITLTLRSLPAQVELAVEDRGIGIEPGYQQKIFDRFFRAPSRQGHAVKGYGLGLSYAAQVVRLHGGQISVRSTPGTGACFTLQLPRRYAH
ncbi:MAG: HAMP domain-containing sensor histidine kinase [Bacteroidia bacterium]|nr:HAMP domain-containing sensor histidine kinase [Bacteroidia bacterium]